MAWPGFANGGYEFRALAADRKEIRLLKLDSAQGDDGELTGTLICCSLYDAPEYEAVCYLWGDPDPHRPRTIHIESRGFRVTENCYYTLHNLRRNTLSRCLWLDQICIDQPNVQERNHQVAIMGDIYRSASTVLACVDLGGPESAIIDNAIVGYHSLVNMNPTTFIEMLSRGSMDGLAELFTSYCTFANKPFWTRLWIFEELLCAKRVHVISGRFQWDWASLLRLNDTLSHVWSDMEEHQKYHINAEQSFARLGLLRGIGHSPKLSFHQALVMSSMLSVIDPRDRVFALLPLIDWPDNVPKIVPDYGRSAHDLAHELIDACEYDLDSLGYLFRALEITSGSAFVDLDDGDVTALWRMKLRYGRKLDEHYPTPDSQANSLLALELGTSHGQGIILSLGNNYKLELYEPVPPSALFIQGEFCSFVLQERNGSVYQLRGLAWLAESSNLLTATSGSHCYCFTEEALSWSELHIEIKLSKRDAVRLVLSGHNRRYVRSLAATHFRPVDNFVHLRGLSSTNAGAVIAVEPFIAHMLERHREFSPLAGRTFSHIYGVMIDTDEEQHEQSGSHGINVARSEEPNSFRLSHNTPVPSELGQFESVPPPPTVPTEMSFIDSGYASKSTKSNAPLSMDSSDTDSVRTDGRSYELEDDRKVALVLELVDELIDRLGDSERSSIVNTTNVLSELEDLLRDFSIILEKAAFERAHGQAGTFIRHQRKAIAAKIYESLKSWRPTPGPTSGERIDLLLWRSSGGTVPLDTGEMTQAAVTELIDDDNVTDANPTAPPAQPIVDKLPPLRDVDKAREFLFDSTEFTWLSDRIKQLANIQQTGGTRDHVRKTVADLLDRLPSGTPLTLSLDWNPIRFLAGEYPEQPRELSQVVVYCGKADCAYATTTLEYLQTHWPAIGENTLVCIQHACNTLDGCFIGEIANAGLELSLGHTEVSIKLTGTARDMLEIAEVCIWLALTCRTSLVDDGVAYCTPKLESAPHMISNRLHLRMQAAYSDLTEHHSMPNGCCWLGMVRNPVIALGYPIPRRDEMYQQTGLEASLSLLVGLSQANWATNFGSAFLLKGIISALVPVMELGASLVWHFLLNQDMTRMTYYQACSACAQLEAMDLYLDDLDSRRHFVGLWTDSARIAAGSNDETLYRLQLSNSKPANDYQCELSNMSIMGGKYLTVGVGFTISRKDIAPALASVANREFSLQIEEASDIIVLFYSTLDRRAWALDGASALLHLARSWMSSKNARFMSPDALEKFKYMDQQGGRLAAVDILKENEKRNIEIFGNTETSFESVMTKESTLGDGSSLSASDSAYSSMGSSDCTKVKDEHKTSFSKWTFKSLVLEFWRVLEAMTDRLHDARLGPPSLTLNPKRIFTQAPLLTGWEMLHLVNGQRHLYPRAVELKSGGEDWIKFARDTYSVVLMARTFGDLMFPERAGECARTSRMPPHLDLLAVPLYLWQPTAERWLYDDDDCTSGCMQIVDGIFWHSYDSVIGPCQCNPHADCNIVSRLGAKQKYNHRTTNGKQQRPTEINIFTEYPMGVALIGGSNKLKKFPKFPRLPPQRITRSSQSTQNGTEDTSCEALPSQAPLPSASQYLTPRATRSDPVNTEVASKASIEETGPSTGRNMVQRPRLAQAHAGPSTERTIFHTSSAAAAANATFLLTARPRPGVVEDAGVCRPNRKTLRRLAGNQRLNATYSESVMANK